MTLFWCSVRYHRRHPWQICLALTGIALGVAVVGAVDLANTSAHRAFQIANEAVSGRSTHHIVGGPVGIPEDTYRRIRLEGGLQSVAPVVTGHAQSVTYPQTFELLGVDPLAERPFRDYAAQLNSPANLETLLTLPGAALLSTDSARRMGITLSERFLLRVNGVDHHLTVVGLVDAANEVTRQALHSIIITDIATAQELLGMVGRLSRIDVALNAVADNAVAKLDAIRDLLPPGIEIIPSTSRTRVQQSMTRAFEINLSALSLLALVVGMFLIYNSMTISVVQRLPQFGLLRALGVTRWQICLTILAEAMVVAWLATGLGLCLGWVLAHGLLQLVTRTINDLYFVLEVRDVAITPGSLVKGVVLGIGATLIACSVPALESLRIDIASVLRRSQVEMLTRARLRWAAVAGLLSLVLGACLLIVPSRSLIMGFTGLFLLIMGTAIFAPGFTVFLLASIQRLLGRGTGMLGRMAIRGVTASLSRTGVAVAALAVALSAVVGVGIMIGSFRSSVEHWLVNYLRADIYIALPDRQTASTLKQEVIDAVRRTPGVDAVSLGRWTTLPGAAGDTELFVLEVDETGFGAFQFKEGDPRVAWGQFESGGGAIVSEPYAYRHRLGVGDLLALRTDSGEHQFRVAGVFYDYGSDQGIVVISRDTYLEFWDDDRVTSLGVYGKSQVDAGTLRESLEADLSHIQPLKIRSNRQLREASLQVFDRTFVITDVLRMVAILVAVVGILSALMTIHLERVREFAVLRAQGLTARQLWGLICAESGLMGLAAGLLALPLGVVTALVLVMIINHRSFGWTMQVTVEPNTLASAVLLAVGTALVAGIYPALKIARAPPAHALRND